jgi:hypothetical protein
VAVQIEPDEERAINPERARKYLEAFFGGASISIYWGSVEDFVHDLRREWNEQYGDKMPI